MGSFTKKRMCHQFKEEGLHGWHLCIVDNSIIPWWFFHGPCSKKEVRFSTKTKKQLISLIDEKYNIEVIKGWDKSICERCKIWISKYEWTDK